MTPEKRYALKRMLSAAGSAADGVKMMFERGTDPICRKIAANPDLMMKIFDDLRDRLAAFYEEMTESEIDAVTAFFSTKAGKAYLAGTMKSAPNIEGVIRGWQQDVLARVGESARGG